MRKSCFMFGHSDCPAKALPKIEQAIDLCYKDGVRDFYVGNRGAFDQLAAGAVGKAKQKYPDIQLQLVLAYHPGERQVFLGKHFDASFYPPLEDVPRPYAIVRANQYMANMAEHLICYVCHVGNARNLLRYAQRKKAGAPMIHNVGETV